MGFVLKYERNGKEQEEVFKSYYLAVAKKADLRKEGISADLRTKTLFRKDKVALSESSLKKIWNGKIKTHGIGERGKW